ncbi:AraC family transcriptional regulator [Mucilaginibacter sp. KACC 22773]|uniref:AraC family transcriptional regulator n=1 Tax=Mucilaginibacter sp. KACC 22773 TaxID=3025671 RepID=UPI002367305F|nr:AraC family transcriptional regulator [Mucilaginibacter sp. KACC 22773]WDF81165.1 AraC family transcriptional regulator [Mucilaginibacter sp. KACC 22773]
MTTSNVMRENTPLTAGDCFTVFAKVDNNFEGQLHYHDDYELHLVLNAKGAKRVVGGHIDVIDDLELVMVGPGLYHGWFTNECKSQQITEIVIQFHKDLFDEKFLQRNQLSFLKGMLQRAPLGVLFSPKTILAVKNRLLALNKQSGFTSVLELLSILHELSTSADMKTLSDPSFINQKFYHNSRRIEKVFEHMNSNYNRKVSLAEVARVVHMPEASFSRFIKKRTGKTFTDSLNEIRLGHATRMLIDSTTTVAEIAYECGFNNISNFNRIFKRKKQFTPNEFRSTYMVASFTHGPHVSLKASVA